MVTALTEIIAVLSNNHIKLKQISQGKSRIIFNVKATGTYSNHFAIKG
jgi:hypothetical protein